MDFTPLTPVSKIQINQQQQQLQQPSERPLDRPTLVRPQRTSMVLIQNQNNGDNSPSPSIQEPFLMMQRQMSTPTMMDPNMMLQLQQHPQQMQGPQSYLSMMPASRGSEPNLNQKAAPSKKENFMVEAPEKEKIEVIPMNLEKPTGLEMG